MMKHCDHVLSLFLSPLDPFPPFMHASSPFRFHCEKC